MKRLGCWHDLMGRKGVGLFEAADAAALHRYLGQCSPFMDIDIAPVLDDEETAAVARSVVADHRS